MKWILFWSKSTLIIPTTFYLSFYFITDLTKNFTFRFREYYYFLQHWIHECFQQSLPPPLFVRSLYDDFPSIDSTFFMNSNHFIEHEIKKNLKNIYKLNIPFYYLASYNGSLLFNYLWDVYDFFSGTILFLFNSCFSSFDFSSCSSSKVKDLSSFFFSSSRFFYLFIAFK